jgi:hypothetical protein
MARHQHTLQGDPARFEAVADFIGSHYGARVRYIADVAGGQGLLCRILRKKYNYDCEVVDPRGWTLRGVPDRRERFEASMADYYDLIVGLHPDQAMREVVQAARLRPAILIPCCNFWSESKLGRDELMDAIERTYRQHRLSYQRVEFAFKGPMNLGILSEPGSEGQVVGADSRREGS